MSSELPSYVQFPNQDVLERRGYNVFSDELEQDEFVFFHATAEENVESILRSGLQPGIQVGRSLHTISFAERSVVALTHWIDIREGREGVILALKFLERNELWQESGSTYSRALKTQPTVIAICPVSSSYRHV